MIPAFTSCSLYLPISASRSVLGITPASDSFVAFTITMNRIVLSLLYQHVERGVPKSTGQASGSRRQRAVEQCLAPQGAGQGVGQRAVDDELVHEPVTHGFGQDLGAVVAAHRHHDNTGPCAVAGLAGDALQVG